MKPPQEVADWKAISKEFENLWNFPHCICDAKYCFTYVDFGQYGSANNSRVLRSSGLYKALEENKFNVPAPTEAEGDEIFSLKTWLMRPFPGSLDDFQDFQLRLSTARRTIENASGILVARSRIFK